MLSQKPTTRSQLFEELSQIYFVNLNPTAGREQSGTRPVLVLSIDDINRLPLVVTVIVGTKGANITRDYPTNVRVSPSESGLPMETVFLCFQLRSLDASRFIDQPVGMLSPEKMGEIETTVILSGIMRIMSFAPCPS